MAEGRITITERIAGVAPAIGSTTVAGLIGTGTGFKAGLENNVPKLYGSATEALTALAPDTGEPTGSLYAALQRLQDNVSGQVIVVQAQSSSAAHVEAATDALENPTDGLFPNIVSTNGLNAAAASAAADDVLGHLDSVCASIDAVWVESIPATGDTKQVQLANMRAYAAANGDQRGIFVPMGTRSGVHVSAGAAFMGAMARRDSQYHRGANVRGMQVHGIDGVAITDYVDNRDPRGNQTDDTSYLLASNIVPLVTRNGLQAWGNRFSAFGAADSNPLSEIGARRTADEILVRAHRIAEPFLEAPEFNPAAPADLSSALSQMLARMQRRRQIRRFLVAPDAAANTPSELASGNLHINIEFSPARSVNSITMVITASAV